jgi:hypothetical protein
MNRSRAVSATETTSDMTQPRRLLKKTNTALPPLPPLSATPEALSTVTGPLPRLPRPNAGVSGHTPKQTRMTI